MRLRETWELHDLSNADVVYCMGRLASKLAVTIFTLANSRHERVCDVADVLFRIIESREEAAVMTAREAVPLEALAREIARQPQVEVTFVWGADHITGFDASLRRMGYDCLRDMWISVR